MKYLPEATARGYDAPQGLSEDVPTTAPTQALAAEICERLVEWAEAEGGAMLRPGDWMMRVGKLYSESPLGFWLYVTAQTGNAVTIAKSFEQLGAEACSPKQAVHQNTMRALEKIDGIFPGLGEALRELARHHRRGAGDNAHRNFEGFEVRADEENE